jgi:Protein of unknown function (DUF2924)
MSPGRGYGDVGNSIAPRASPHTQAEALDATIAGLCDLDASQLHLQWRNLLGGTVPAHLPRWLLLKVLGYRLQAIALGDLDKATVRSIRASQDNAIDFAGGPFKKRRPRTRDGVGLNSGALLVREWKGKLERVMVLDSGFAWNGRVFGSLSQVAKAITGTSWNGHRFFGLRSTKEPRSERGETLSNVSKKRGSEAARFDDLTRAASKADERGRSKGIGRDETERVTANAKRSEADLTRRRVSTAETKPHGLLEGEPRRDTVEVCR